ncbi:MobF family relaxase [Afipia birgiae]|uniref:MobF family relaxase n=1 Tax=Afipia birgiae TaxID=151414 RepID=UPI00058C13CF|nr:MobF family relaxase [Afipia birgiae]
MVATIAAGTTAQYYSKQSEYYLGGHEPAGRWISATNDLGVTHGAEIENAVFERLHAGVDEDGQLLLTNAGDVAKRVAGIDLTLSAPKSVSAIFALADDETRRAIEVAQQRACEATIAFLDRHAAFCRRGKNGLHLERASLTVASFQHGEARPVAHDSGKIFADPNLHTHNVILNCAVRADGTIGALDARHLFAHKMAAGATYHLALATELQKLGFAVADVGKNGIFEIAGVPRDLREYFSARRHEVESAIAAEGLTTSEAPVLAAAIAKGTRTSKQEQGPNDRFAVWANEASRFVDVERFVADLQTYRDHDPAEHDKIIAERMAALPDQLTAHESVFEARQLYAAVATALVGTGANAKRVDFEAERLVEMGVLVELGRDKLSQPIYSTATQIAIERNLLALTVRLLNQRRSAPDEERVAELCRAHGLNEGQARAARSATTTAAVAIVEGAAGSGKTTMLAPVVAAYRAAGMRVIGTATAWKIANQLKDDLGIQAKATDAWIASARAGGQFLDRNTVLVVDEAGLLSSRQMYDSLAEVERAGAKVVLVGDRQQLQAVGAGPGLAIVASVTDQARVDNIVRQHEAWARRAVTDFARGNATEGLQAYSERGLLTIAASEKLAIRQLVDAWAATQQVVSNPSTLLIAKTNAQVRALNEEVRAQLKAPHQILGDEIAISAVTPSGHGQTLNLAMGDRIRFLMRQDALGVVNGTTATITHIDGADGEDPTISVVIGDRLTNFRPSDLADEHGRAQLGHAYATTIYGCQGLTTDHAFVLLDPSMNRHDIYVAASRARIQTQHFLSTQGCDAHIKLELPLSERRGAVIDQETRMAWLAARLSRVQVKSCTLDPTLEFAARSRAPEREQSRSYDRG